MSISYNFLQRTAIGVTTGLFALTTFVVYTRLYIRCILIKAGSAGYDDLTVFIAWVMALGASIATYFEVISGLGRHIEELSPKQVYNFGLSLFIVIQFYNVGLNIVKISFLCQYHRLFPDPLIRRICMYFGVFCFFWMFVQAVLYAFSCVPITGLVPGMKVVCVPTLPTWTAISCVNVFTDLLIFCIPLKPLWGMSLLKRQRYLLIGIFCIGFLVCIISTIRIPTLRRGAASPDPSFTNVTTALWSLAELDTAILCTSLPILRPLVARFVRGIAPPDAHAPADGLKAGPGPGRRPRGPGPGGVGVDPAHGGRHRRRLSHKLPGESLLYDTGLSGSTLLRSGSRSFLRSLLSSRARDQEGDAELQEDHRRAVPEVTTMTVEVDVAKGDYGSPLDAPPGTYKRDPQEKLVPRPPLTFYPQMYYHPDKRLPAVPSIPPAMQRQEFTRQAPSPTPVIITTSPLTDTINLRNKPPYHSPTSTSGTSFRWPSSAAASSDAVALSPASRPILPSPDDSFTGTLPFAATITTMTPSSSPGGSHGRHRRLSPAQPPRGDSFTLPFEGAHPSPEREGQQHQHQQHQQRPQLRPNSSSSQICSRCASSLAQHPLLPSPPAKVPRREDYPARSRSSQTAEDEGDGRREADAAAGEEKPRRAWDVASRSTQTQTEGISWIPRPGRGAGGRDEEEGGDEGGREQQRQQQQQQQQQQQGEGEERRVLGRVTSGRAVRVAAAAVVDVAGGAEKRRSWRGQVRFAGENELMTTTTTDDDDGGGGGSSGSSSSVEEILPRRGVLRKSNGEEEEEEEEDDRDDASALEAPRRPDHERREMGTSWLRLSIG